MSVVKKGSENLPWIEKYRPENLDQVYGQSNVVTTVRRFMQEGRLPHMLFYGPPGTGKTSTVIALAKEIYGPKYYKNMILELNASDDRGIDVVRNQIKDFASTRQIFSKQQQFKLIILDEADAMTSAAQNALRRVIEKYTKNTRFCILANYAHKLTPALLSRCTRFRFQPLPPNAIASRLETVLIKEHLSLTDDAKTAILKISNGDMRKALNVLQACSSMVAFNEGKSDTEQVPSSTREITQDMIYDCVGAPKPSDLEYCLNSILNDDRITSFYTIEKLKRECGLALLDLINGIVEILDDHELSETTRSNILIKLSEIEYAMSKGGNDKIQTSAMIGVIKSSF
ncbi:Subunit of heteropentameric Replication factor C (RF-C) [Hanseniaspora vineae]